MYVLRIDSRIVSGKTGFAEAYALTGPPSGGKSFIALRHLRFLGQKAENLVQPLPTSYFVTPPPPNAEGSRPVTAACRGAKLVVPKEMPVKPIVAESLKGILDPRDVDVSARSNFSKAREQTCFEITWSILIQSQGALHIAADDNDCGIMDKLVELRPPFEFVSPDEWVAKKGVNTRLRPADKDLLDATDRGDLNGEMFFHSTIWYDLLDEKCCPHRTIQPKPPSALAVVEENKVEDKVERIKVWITTNLVECSEKDATGVKEVHAALKDALGAVEPSLRTACGFSTGQYRRGPKSGHHDFYKVNSKPMMIKPS